MALRYYEGLWLFDSAIAVKDWEQLFATVEGILKKHGARIMRLEKWDDWKLAYDVKKVKRGTYLLGHFQAEPAALEAINRECRLTESVLRHLIVEVKDLPKKLEERAELKKKREAEAAQAVAEGMPLEGAFDRRERRRDRDRDRGDREGGYGGGYGGRARAAAAAPSDEMGE
jgi:small subunit ribosomal protein S6